MKLPLSTSTINVGNRRSENHVVREREYVVELISQKGGHVFPFFQATFQQQAMISSGIERTQPLIGRNVIHLLLQTIFLPYEEWLANSSHLQENLFPELY